MTDKVLYKGEFLSQAAIAKLEGVTKQRINQRIKEHGTPMTMRDAGIARRAPKRKAALTHLYNGEWLPKSAIAEREGVTVSALGYRMKKFGKAEKMPYVMTCQKCHRTGHSRRWCKLG
jgi:hypothetical protein